MQREDREPNSITPDRERERPAIRRLERPQRLAHRSSISRQAWGSKPAQRPSGVLTSRGPSVSLPQRPLCRRTACRHTIAAMLLSEVGYARPATLEQALGVLAEHTGGRALAGGQTLINVMKARAASPDVLVDLQDLEELRGVRDLGSGSVEIGAMTTYSDLIGDEAAGARSIL